MTIIAKICPILKGVGISTMVMVTYYNIYYCVIISWSLYYFIASFMAIPDLPWNTDAGYLNRSDSLGDFAIGGQFEVGLYQGRANRGTGHQGGLADSVITAQQRARMTDQFGDPRTYARQARSGTVLGHRAFDAQGFNPFGALEHPCTQPSPPQHRAHGLGLQPAVPSPTASGP